MTLTDKQKYILAGTIAVGAIAVYIQSSKRPFIKPTNVVYPPKATANGNRIFNIIRSPSELNDIIIQHPPLLLNFVRLGEPASNKLTIALQDIVGNELSNKQLINMASVECDNPENLSLMLKYTVNDVPSIVCLTKQLPGESYVDKKLNKSQGTMEVDKDALQKWVESQIDSKQVKG